MGTILIDYLNMTKLAFVAAHWLGVLVYVIACGVMVWNAKHFRDMHAACKSAYVIISGVLLGVMFGFAML